MPLASLCFVLIAVHVSVMVDSKPWQHKLDLQTSLTNPARTKPRYIGQREPMSSSEWPNFLVILPVKTHTSNFVSIFNLRRKRFLCMDQEGELFNSRHSNTEDCLYQRLWLDWPIKHDVYYSTRGARLLKLQGVELNVAMQESSQIANIRHKLLERLKRQRRSQEVNPSDPLRSETHPTSNKMETDNLNRDQTGAVSKETITSCDDPLKVLQTNGSGSPVKNNIGNQAEDAKVVVEI
ncbi:fibroblast growth factor 23 [Boleophthalmus pectinirostris]|uniref:fibroblast growth factor 23 n=1 Tax=Boleophthalmus pectinirostris TaxID=150288 RepID=UPI000A1C72FE|nr:fibroblast growth factor 23 [Boleophthalmus pectinirostris]